jgi:hypothetical protein
MTKISRGTLATDISNNIYTNTQRRIKGNTVRDRLINVIDSSLNIIDDANVPGGYLAIDADGRVDVSFIKSDSPSGLFLRDDGTWAAGGGGGGDVSADIAVINGRLDNLEAQSATFQPTSEKGANNGYASLDSGGKVPASQLPSTLMTLKGSWDANENTPTLENGTGDVGDVYECTFAGTTDFGDGNITFKIGDWAVYGANGKWYKSLNSNEVTSVNGQTGTVVLTTTHISEGTGLYFTDARARTAAVENNLTASTTIAPSKTAVNTAVAAKLDVESPSTTGTALTFETDRVYGSIASPETGNITFSTTNAKVGVTNIIIHNSGSAPTFAANMKKLSGSGDYVTSAINYIYVSYINSTEVIYAINQRT